MRLSPWGALGMNLARHQRFLKNARRAQRLLLVSQQYVPRAAIAGSESALLRLSRDGILDWASLID